MIKIILSLTSNIAPTGAQIKQKKNSAENTKT